MSSIPSQFAQSCARGTEEAERARRLGQPELGGERERPLRRRDCLRESVVELAPPGELGVGGDMLGPRRLRLEQGQRFGDGVLAVGIAETSEDECQLGQRPARGHALTRRAIRVERFLEG